MTLYKCDFCKKIVGEKQIKRLFISREYGIDKEGYDICEECADKLKKIVEKEEW